MAHERAAKAGMRKERNPLLVLAHGVIQPLALVAHVAKGRKPRVALPRDALHACLAECEFRMLVPAHAERTHLGRGKQPLHRRMQTSPYAPPVRQNERQFIPCMLLAGEIERDNLPAQKLRSGLCGLHRAPHGRCIDPVEPIPGNPPADRLRLPEPKRRQGVRIITGIAVADKVQQHGITPFPLTVFILA